MNFSNYISFLRNKNIYSIYLINDEDISEKVITDYLDEGCYSIKESIILKQYLVNKNCFGNPSSTHQHGQKSHNLIEKSRISIAKTLNCKTSEIIFTSGGSESFASDIAPISMSELKRDTNPTSANPIVPDSTENSAIGSVSDVALGQFRNSIKFYYCCEKY